MHLDNVLIYENKIDICMKIDINGDIYIFENRHVCIYIDSVRYGDIYISENRHVCRYIDSVRYGDKNILKYIEINNFSNCVAC